MLSALSIESLFIVCIAIMFIGLAKAGLAGAGTLTIPIMAAILGGRASVGFLLPILLLCDIIAIIYYKKSTNWKILIRTLPWAIVGIALATIVGSNISEYQFNIILASVILSGVVITVYRDYISKKKYVPTHWTFSAIMGLLVGFASMIGNAAGPLIAIFLLTLQLQKEEFSGTRAWYFLIINSIKFPLHTFVWHSITVDSMLNGMMLIPAGIVGMIIGFKLIKVLPEKVFRITMLCLTFLSAIALFFK